MEAAVFSVLVLPVLLALGLFILYWVIRRRSGTASATPTTSAGGDGPTAVLGERRRGRIAGMPGTLRTEPACERPDLVSARRPPRLAG
jgi:hypothetical protein